MADKIREAFSAVKAEEALKEDTKDFLKEKMQRASEINLWTESQNKPKTPSELGPRKKVSGWQKGIYAAACLLMLTFGMGGYGLYFTETAYISIDVNPSLELGINRFERVISVESYNEDGENIKNRIKVKHENYANAVELLLNEDILGVYVEEEGWLSFTVATDDMAEKERILSKLESCSNNARVKADCSSMGTELMEEAHHKGLSFGKYSAYLEAKDCGSSITERECKDMSMKEIREQIMQCEEGGGNGKNGQGQGNGGGNGNNGQGKGGSGHRHGHAN